MTAVKVPFIDLRQRFEEEKSELLACVERVLSLGHFVLTQEVDEFERQAAAYAGAKHCIGLNSGTDALMIFQGPEAYIRSPTPRLSNGSRSGRSASGGGTRSSQPRSPSSPPPAPSSMSAPPRSMPTSATT